MDQNTEYNLQFTVVLGFSIMPVNSGAIQLCVGTKRDGRQCCVRRVCRCIRYNYCVLLICHPREGPRGDEKASAESPVVLIRDWKIVKLTELNRNGTELPFEVNWFARRWRWGGFSKLLHRAGVHAPSEH